MKEYSFRYVINGKAVDRQLFQFEGMLPIHTGPYSKIAEVRVATNQVRSRMMTSLETIKNNIPDYNKDTDYDTYFEILLGDNVTARLEGVHIFTDPDRVRMINTPTDCWTHVPFESRETRESTIFLGHPDFLIESYLDGDRGKYVTISTSGKVVWTVELDKILRFDNNVKAKREEILAEKPVGSLKDHHDRAVNKVLKMFMLIL